MSQTEISCLCTCLANELPSFENSQAGDKEMSSVFADQQLPRIRVHMRGDWDGGCGCGVSANQYSCAHHVTWGPNKNFGDPYLTYAPRHLLVRIFYFWFCLSAGRRGQPTGRTVSLGRRGRRSGEDWCQTTTTPLHCQASQPQTIYTTWTREKGGRHTGAH
jgi:hypothetical protein